MNIFEALRESHEVQRGLTKQLLRTSGDSHERSTLFEDLKTVLSAHALAEERHLYVPLMDTDSGLDLSRHAISEHHEIDELVESLEETDPSSPGWIAIAKKLSEKVHHHLTEEEHKFFQMAGKILSEKQKSSLAELYLAEYEKALAS